MNNEEFGCAMQARRKVILHYSFFILHSSLKAPSSLFSINQLVFPITEKIVA